MGGREFQGNMSNFCSTERAQNKFPISLTVPNLNIVKID